MRIGREDGGQDPALCCLQSALFFVYFVKREICFTYKDTCISKVNE